MERLMMHYETAERALHNLQRGIELFENLKKTSQDYHDEYFVHRDSLVKRFELAFDTLWKYAKIYLEVKEGIVQNSPKSVFKECLRINLIAEDDTTKALLMVDVRNMTSHTYREEVAEEISHKIKVYYQLMNKIITRLKT